MSIFGGKKNTDEANVQSGGKAQTDDLLRVLDESVWESVHEDLKANKQFILRDADGKPKYVAFLLDTAQFGGLAGKDARKDESKGSIIEAIKTGRIKTYLRTEMLMSGLIIIIPDRDTIENMDEFNLFNHAEYVLCTISNEGAVVTETVNGTDDKDDPEVVKEFAEIKNVVRSGGSARVFFTAGGMGPVFNNGSNKDAEAAPAEEPEEIEMDPDEVDERRMGHADPAPVKAAPEPAPVAEPEPETLEDVDMSDNDLLDDINYESSPVDSDYDESDGEYDESAAITDEYTNEDIGGYDEYEDITHDVVQDWVVRKFYSSDLGLEISTQPFDAQFLHGNEYVPFNENRGEGWLNEYLSNMSKDANTRMERMHSENLFRMREKYMRLIQESCANIAKILDLTSDTQYGRMKIIIDQNHDANIEKIDEIIETKRQQLEDAWQATLEQVGRAAYEAAKSDHINKYESGHKEDIANLAKREKEEIDMDYQESLARMQEDRRAEATKLLDIAVNETLSKLSKAYTSALEAEGKVYEKLQAQMAKFIDENRKDEKARIEALAEENRQVKKANEVRGEYISKIKTMSAEFDMKKAALQADIDRMRREHDDELRACERDLASRLEVEKEKNKLLQEQLDALRQQYKDSEDNKDKEFDDRIRQIDAVNNEQVQSIIESQKKSSKTTLCISIAAVVICLVIGFIVGSSTSKSVQQPVAPAAGNSIVVSADADMDVDTSVATE